MIHDTTYTEARERLAALVNQVADTGEPVLIRRRGDEPVALVPVHEVACWLETVFQLRSPKNARRLLAASRRAADGEGDHFTVPELRQRLGLVAE